MLVQLGSDLIIHFLLAYWIVLPLLNTKEGFNALNYLRIYLLHL